MKIFFLELDLSGGKLKWRFRLNGGAVF
jgi:hypothetical protein